MSAPLLSWELLFFLVYTTSAQNCISAVALAAVPDSSLQTNRSACAGKTFPLKAEKIAAPKKKKEKKKVNHLILMQGDSIASSLCIPVRKISASQAQTGLSIVWVCTHWLLFNCQHNAATVGYDSRQIWQIPETFIWMNNWQLECKGRGLLDCKAPDPSGWWKSI